MSKNTGKSKNYPNGVWWNGKQYSPGLISEEMYEDIIDLAYGRGDNLKNTSLWKDGYQYGLVCPQEGYWHAFVYTDKGQYRYLGAFDESIFPDVSSDDWDDSDYDWDDSDYDDPVFKIYSQAEEADSDEAISILRKLYLDPRSGEHDQIDFWVANDPECLQWMAAYLAFLRYNERNNLAGFDDFGGLQGFIDYITDPEYALEYLGNFDIDETKQLADELKALHRRLPSASRNRKPLKTAFGKKRKFRCL